MIFLRGCFTFTLLSFIFLLATAKNLIHLVIVNLVALHLLYLVVCFKDFILEESQVGYAQVCKLMLVEVP